MVGNDILILRNVLVIIINIFFKYFNIILFISWGNKWGVKKKEGGVGFV